MECLVIREKFLEVLRFHHAGLLLIVWTRNQLVQYSLYSYNNSGPSHRTLGMRNDPSCGAWDIWSFSNVDLIGNFLEFMILCWIGSGLPIPAACGLTLKPKLAVRGQQVRGSSIMHCAKAKQNLPPAVWMDSRRVTSSRGRCPCLVSKCTTCMLSCNTRKTFGLMGKCGKIHPMFHIIFWNQSRCDGLNGFSCRGGGRTW